MSNISHLMHKSCMLQVVGLVMALVWGQYEIIHGLCHLLMGIFVFGLNQSNVKISFWSIIHIIISGCIGLKSH